ncbi:hypothetical protein E6C27_scaffold335G00490 [Cucumis melo var. makuwa]|uniref:Uncharacterized protein n=2 Tax=Cucumis melo TaxID=3656 RepID=A0A5A7TJV8_CUCMM|nr:hypothetical protein E6C27_scaffold335G00490 [Cucumis melo var. makuwa]
MKFQKIAALLIVCVVFGIVFSHIDIGTVDAARMLFETLRDDHDVDCVDPYSIDHHKAKDSVKCWLENLGSGPSLKGPGHGTRPPAHVR